MKVRPQNPLPVHLPVNLSNLHLWVCSNGHDSRAGKWTTYGSPRRAPIRRCQSSDQVPAIVRLGWAGVNGARPVRPIQERQELIRDFHVNRVHTFVRVHKTLGTTQAVAAGLEDHEWSIEELMALLEEREALALEQA